MMTSEKETDENNSIAELSSGTITKLEWQKKNKDRLNVFLDHQYAFSCHVDLVFEFKLDKGLYLDSATILQLLEADALKRGYLFALKSVLMKDQTSHELKRRMLGKAYSESVIEAVLERLIEEAYIDDAGFATRYIEARSHLYGPHRLRQSLKLKGLSQESIDIALKRLVSRDRESIERLEVSDADLSDPVLEMALKKMQQCKGLDTQKMMLRVTGFLQRRGFDHQTVNRVMKEVKSAWSSGKE